jgi:hypothetical protein
MQTFVVRGTNRPGELANLAGALASRNVNVLLTVLGMDGQALAGFICSDEESARSALEEAGYEHQAYPTVTVRLADRPGQAADVARKLGDQGVNIQCLFPVSITAGEAVVAIAVDNSDAATTAVGDQITDFTYS